jgi:hypothetical protein
MYVCLFLCIYVCVHAPSLSRPSPLLISLFVAPLSRPLLYLFYFLTLPLSLFSCSLSPLHLEFYIPPFLRCCLPPSLSTVFFHPFIPLHPTPLYIPPRLAHPNWSFTFRDSQDAASLLSFLPSFSILLRIYMHSGTHFTCAHVRYYAFTSYLAYATWNFSFPNSQVTAPSSHPKCLPFSSGCYRVAVLAHAKYVILICYIYGKCTE